MEGGGACCYHCGRNESDEIVAKKWGRTLKEWKKEKDECNRCCAMIRDFQRQSNEQRQS